MEVRSPQQQKIKQYELKMKYPTIFFRTCCKCGYAFKKTAMWTWEIPDDLGNTFRKWGCERCFPDYQSILKYLGIKDD